MQESPIRRLGALGIPDLISFAPGYPAPELFAWEEFRDVAQSVLDGSDGTVLQYGPTRGFRPLVEGLTEILAERGIAAVPEDILVTTGSQQALDLCARIFIDPGDVVLVELPTYTGAIAAFRNAGASLVGVRQGADGLDFDDLDRVLTRERSAGSRIRVSVSRAEFSEPDRPADWPRQTAAAAGMGGAVPGAARRRRSVWRAVLRRRGDAGRYASDQGGRRRRLGRVS